MKQDLILIGASGVAHEILDTIHDLNLKKNEWNVLGVLDDDPSKIGKEFYQNTRILGDRSYLSKVDQTKVQVLVTFSSPATFLKRHHYIEMLKAEFPKLKFATLVHPTAYISPSAEIGEGSYIGPGVIIDSCASVGDHVIILFHSVVSRFVSVDDYTFISASVNIVGNRKIGKSVYLGAKATINANLQDNILVDSAVLIKMDIESNAIVSSTVVPNILKYPSVDKMQMMLARSKS